MEGLEVRSSPRRNGFLVYLEILSDIIERITKVACVLAVSSMTLIVFTQVICRFVFNSALPWPEEASRYLMIWTCFLGSSLAIKYGEHIGVLFVIEKFPVKARKFISVVVKSVVIIFLVFASYQGFKMLEFARMQISPASRINMAIAYAAIPIGCIFGLLHAIENLFEKTEQSDVVLSI